jgi:3-dehydroquinate synthase
VAVISIGGVSEILIGRGLLEPVTVLGESRPRSVVAIACQPTVAPIARDLARLLRSDGLRADVRVLPDGERSKTLEIVADLYGWLAELGADRSDTLVAVGGGALTDAAGFAAATYLRGIEVVNIPTTLLGAVDASVGGKTGVNFGAKNLIGAFHHPFRVVIDIDVLDRLPVGLKRQGAAEALKAGMIGDGLLVEQLEQDGLDADLYDVVTRAVAVKADIVGRDFTESGDRAFLNYGHTVAHAVETSLGLPHGEAVAVGMIAAGRVSAVRCGFEDEERQRSAILRLGLPDSVSGADPQRVTALLSFDKKRDAAGLRMVLLEAIGAPRVSHVDTATVGSALEAVGIA